MTDVLNSMIPALLELLTFSHMGALMIGVAAGLALGVLPGLGGIAGLSLMIPFTFDMQPSMALAMMMGLLAPLHTCDVFPAILMGIPGSSSGQATVLDGFPLSRRGEAARALSAAFVASVAGGVFGSLVLTIAVFGARPIILSMGFGELMMLTVFALSVVGMLTESSPLKGLAACGVGLLAGTIGGAPATGEFRMTFDTLYLSDGIPLVIVGLGLFAIPEIIDLLRRHVMISESGTLGKGWLQGARDVVKNWWVVLRCSALGSLLGMLPGIGGSVGDWIAYAHVVQTTKNRDNFGKGDVRGVIAPESANNAVTGGSLIPTLLFGIPGSGSMAVLLGGFVLIGIQPGPSMVSDNLDLTFTIIWSLAIANILGAGACFLMSNPVSKLTIIPYSLIAPIMLVILFFGAFQATRTWDDFFALVAIGVAGVYMKRFGWPRPALLIGFVLSRALEVSFYRVAQVYSWSFLSRPLVLVIIVLTALSIYAAWRLRPRPKPIEGDSPSLKVRAPQIAFTSVLIVAILYVLYDASQKTELAAIFPAVVGVLTLCLIVPVLIPQIFASHPKVGIFADADLGEPTQYGDLHYVLWILGMLACFGLFGFLLGSAIFVFVFTTVKVGGPLWRNALLGAGCHGLFLLLSHLLNLYYPPGLLPSLLPGWGWLG